MIESCKGKEGQKNLRNLGREKRKGGLSSSLHVRKTKQVHGFCKNPLALFAE